jgi:tetratricopeptide (TPR) repeat protein
MLSARRRRRAANFACFVALSTVIPGLPPFALAALAADAPKTSPEATAAAHQHATRAHDLYLQGAYHEAIAELDVALKLDPNGKDLVFNLGVVHEKLGNIADALRYFERYEQMDLAPAERAKADTYLKRLQGARKEVEKPVEITPPPPLPPPPPPAVPEEKHYGRFDWLTATTGALGLGGLAVGAAFGVKALQERPVAGMPAVGPNGYAQVENAQASAHTWAIRSDIFLAAGAANVVAAAVLFFARTRDSASRKAGIAGPQPAPIVVSGTPIRGGGALLIEARF